MFKNIYADEHRITQILINFLSNAFKLTPEYGDIRVELVITEDEVINENQNNH